ncbi:hypothetical protein JTY60_00730 [symbiont of Argiope bruennichi]|uniref:FtsX-like permease family protein n=1 Tax=symbiont of Argiope bruennichi TaxID=2810479 RepID=UPI003DA40BB8
MLNLISYNFSVISVVLIIVSIVSSLLCILVVSMIMKFFIEENSYSISVLKAMGWTYREIVGFFGKIIVPSIILGFFTGQFIGKIILDKISWFASSNTEEYINLSSNYYVILIACLFTLVLYLIVLSINFVRLKKINVVILLKK